MLGVSKNDEGVLSFSRWYIAAVLFWIVVCFISETAMAFTVLGLVLGTGLAFVMFPVFVCKNQAVQKGYNVNKAIWVGVFLGYLGMIIYLLMPPTRALQEASVVHHHHHH